MSTFRVVKYTFALLGLAAIVITIARLPGNVRINLSDVSYTIDTAYVALIFIIASVTLFLLCACFLYLWRLPIKQAERLRARRRARARLVLGESYMALARNDIAAARKLIKRAQAGLPDDELAIMMSADLAWRDGDLAAAHQQFDILQTTHPQAAYQGKFTLSLATKDVVAARAALEAGLRDDRGSRWALQASFDLALYERSWVQAEAIAGQMQRADLLTKPEARRFSAMLMLEDLYRSQSALSTRMRLHRASKIIRLAPSFVPAIVALVDALVADGQGKKAQTRLAAAWAQRPHADLTAQFLRLHADLPIEEQVSRAQKFVGKKRDDVDSLLLRAHLAIKARRWAQAEKLLEGLTHNQLTRLVCEYMAELKRGQDEEGAAREWLSRALTAPVDACWHDDGVPQVQWSAIGPVSGQFDNVVWGSPAGCSGAVLENAASEADGNAEPMALPKAEMIT